MTLVAIAALMGLAAALYSSIGHGGASAYLATMALFAVAPDTMRPALNLVVAAVVAGTLLGTWLGSARLPKPRLLQGPGAGAGRRRLQADLRMTFAIVILAGGDR